MARIYDVSAVTDSAQIPIKQGTLQFLQDMNTERFAALIIALIGPSYTTSTVYVLSGVVNTGSETNYIISSGAAFYNGEVFLIDPATFTVTGGNVAVFNIGVTQYTTNADPVTFTDTTIHNVHNIRKLVVSGAASGSGIADYSATFFMSFFIPSQVNLMAPTATPYVGNQLQIIGAYPNLTFYVPPAGNLNPVLYAGSWNLGDADTGAGLDTIITFPTLSTSNYYVMGTMIGQGTPNTDTSIIWTIRNRTSSQFTIHCREFIAGVQDLAFEFLLFAK